MKMRENAWLASPSREGMARRGDPPPKTSPLAKRVKRHFRQLASRAQGQQQRRALHPNGHAGAGPRQALRDVGAARRRLSGAHAHARGTGHAPLWGRGRPSAAFGWTGISYRGSATAGQSDPVRILEFPLNLQQDKHEHRRTYAGQQEKAGDAMQARLSISGKQRHRQGQHQVMPSSDKRKRKQYQAHHLLGVGEARFGCALGQDRRSRH